jgi:hypothetical protein
VRAGFPDFVPLFMLIEPAFMRVVVLLVSPEMKGTIFSCYTRSIAPPTGLILAMLGSAVGINVFLALLVLPISAHFIYSDRGEEALFDALYLSTRRGRRLRHFPELSWTADFSRRELREWIAKIDNSKLRRAVTERGDVFRHKSHS